MNRYAIIVGAGKGERMGSDIPKQFLELNGLPVLMHTMRRFHESVSPRLILVLNVHFHDYWEGLCDQYDFRIPHELIKGGVTRFDSVKNGLKAVKGKGVVAVHDAVRPLASHQLIRNCFETARDKGSAVPAVPSRESLRRGSLDRSESVSRDEYFLVQTPQCFDSTLLRRAYRQEFRNEFTDDASVVERSGQPIQLVEGEFNNIKITYPDDFRIAELLLTDKK